MARKHWRYCLAKGRAILGLTMSLCALSGVQDALPLEPIGREIAVGESHLYQITLSAGQYLHAEIEQYVIEVAVALFDKAGE
ncbi:MAG: hypothetical protein ACREEM_48475, partial [Blastocatellia bacterium]